MDTWLMCTPEDIISIVSIYKRVPVEDITGSTKKREAVYARELATYVLITRLKMKPPAIAQILKKERTSIIDISQRIQAKKDNTYKNGHPVDVQAQKDIRYLTSFFSNRKIS